jgi:hypothetical protein
MRAQRWASRQIGKSIAIVLGLAVVVALIALTSGSRSPVAAQAEGKLEATIFSFDGKDFTRTKTTLVTEDGKSAVNTKLDHSTPAYKALLKKHSYVGEAEVFGHKYDADYAPLTGADGKLTGALFVATPK